MSDEEKSDGLQGGALATAIDPSPGGLLVYRILLVIGAGANLLYWWTHHYFFSPATDPLEARLAFSGFMLVGLVATWFSAALRRNLRRLMLVCVYLFVPHLLFILHTNNLGYFPTTNTVIFLGALAASFPFTFVSVRSLTLFLGTFTLGFGIVLFLTKAPLNYRMVSGLTVLTMEVLCYTALFFRYRALEKAAEAEEVILDYAGQLRRYDFIVNTSREFMTLISRDYVYEAVNQSYIDARDTRREDIVGHTVWDIWGKDLFENAIRPHLEDCFAGNDVNYQLPLQFPGKGSRFFDISYYPYRDEHEVITHAVVVTRDITEQRRAEERLRHEALHDSLTGLPNRQLFMDRIEQALQMAQRMPDYGFAVLIVDLDRFKIVNDSLGHQVGDRMLVETARRLHAVLRRVDTTARLGGDEFAVLVNGARRPEDAAYVADRIVAQMAEPFELEGVEIFTSATLGIALSEPSYKDPLQVLRDADTALYRAKQRGGGMYEIFRREMHMRALSLLHMGADLRGALARGELIPYYMPIVDAKTFRVRSVEALIRWVDPNRGIIPPARFIGFAEETGMIVEIGKSVLNQTLRELHRWRERGVAVTTAVNFSARQFQMPELTEYLGSLLREWSLPPESLELEITESAFIGHEERAEEEMHRLMEAGLRLSIDDFGTGYSSLGYLRRFPFHKLKIDRSFVFDSDAVHGSGKSLPILVAIIRMARDMGLEVVAEGVETQAQLDMLLELGVDGLQGFCFSRPVPAKEMLELLEQGTIQPAPLAVPEGRSSLKTD